MTDSKLDFPVSWEELHRTAKVLAHRLYDLPPFDGVVAITRGGLVPAAIVARELGIRMIDTVCVISYGAAEATETSEAIQGELQIVKSPNVPNDGAGWLIVDDLVDTGVTAKAVRKLLPKAHFATVYAKPSGRPMVDTFVTEVSQDTWIHFPWDLAPQPIAPISRSRVL